MNGHNVIRFDDGTKLKTCTKYTYLGHHIAQSLNVRQEVGQRMQQTMKTWFKLEPVWKTAHCDHPKQTRQCVKNPSRYPNHVKEDGCVPPPWASLVHVRTADNLCLS